MKKLTRDQKKINTLKATVKGFIDADVRHGNRIQELERELASRKQVIANWEGTCKDLTIKRDQYYAESNAKTHKIQRLENAVKSLKEGSQKILLAFDTLN